MDHRTLDHFCSHFRPSDLHLPLHLPLSCHHLAASTVPNVLLSKIRILFLYVSFNPFGILRTFYLKCSVNLLVFFFFGLQHTYSPLSLLSKKKCTRWVKIVGKTLLTTIAVREKDYCNRERVNSTPLKQRVDKFLSSG